MVIFEWKTRGRGKSRLESNEDVEIKDALSLACAAQTPRAAIAVLNGLRGIDVSVASAIMTAVYPERFTVIDFRALESLGCVSTNRSIAFYLCYLAYCQRLAHEWDLSLRKLDICLWQWSKMAKLTLGNQVRVRLNETEGFGGKP